jgi:Rrf2 family iron-sulfur cluster assembly transcriptional regulator
MELIRRNTDYALRAMLKLASQFGNEPVSSKELAQQGRAPYQLVCKLMQKLHNAKLVKSCMGPKGGFKLSKEPSKISLLEVVEAIQGPVKLNRCLLGNGVCPQQKNCKVRLKLAELEDSINNYLGSVKLNGLVKSTGLRSKKRHDIGRKR